MPAIDVKRSLTKSARQGIIDTMASHDSTLAPRPRWYAVTILGAILLIAALSTAAAVVEDDLADTVLGFFTGAIAALVIVLVLWTEITRTLSARRRDAATLDDLEPLRAATIGDRSPTDSASADRQSTDQATAESRSDRPADR